jgi:hypothetical protein
MSIQPLLTSFLADVVSKRINWLFPVSILDLPMNLVGMSGEMMLKAVRWSMVAGVLSLPIQVERSDKILPLENDIGVACNKRSYYENTF